MESSSIGNAPEDNFKSAQDRASFNNLTEIALAVYLSEEDQELDDDLDEDLDDDGWEEDSDEEEL
jgi:hypothetical protein